MAASSLLSSLRDRALFRRQLVAATCWDRAATAYLVICVSAAFVFSVAVTTESAAGGGVVSRGGAADGPLGDDRAEVAAASDVEVILSRCSTNERTNARWRYSN